eukprot:TRINITY_DN16102_c0_g2_i1.p1 TRINITY_DN16102_c0_g2~~TRINITY_DN16102_c0_g2_i1.p1  ORF type:complete len:3781 (+),score=536.68 TRINITY_DN16102_c0_g2_i1:971-11344(+)
MPFANLENLFVTDRSRKITKRGSKCKVLPVRIPSRVAKKISDFSLSEELSAESILLAAWVAVVGGYTGNKAITLGIQTSSSDRGVGMYEQIIPCTPSGDSFAEICSSSESILTGVRTTTKHSSFYRILQSLDPTMVGTFCRYGFRCFGVSGPSARVLPFVFSHGPDMNHGFGSRPTPMLPDEFIHSLFDLQLICSYQDGSLQAAITYSEEYSKSHVADMCENYLNLLEEGMDGGVSRIVCPRQSTEVQKILTAESEVATNKSLPRMLEIAAVESPEVTAILDGPMAVSYDKLNSQSNQYARFLTSTLTNLSGTLRQKRVAILVPHSYFSTLTVISVLKASGVYVPLDPTAPFYCILSILNKCRIHAIITSKRYKYFDNLMEWNEMNHHTKVLCQEVVGDLFTSCESGNLEDQHRGGDDAAMLSFPALMQDSDLAGDKNSCNCATVVTHGRLYNQAVWSKENRPMLAGIRVLFGTPAFSTSYSMALWSSISCGATLCVVDFESETHSSILSNFIYLFSIERIFVSPTYLADLATVCRVLNGRPSSLRDIIVCGEGFDLTPALVYFFQHSPFSSVHIDYYGNQQTIISTTKLTGAAETWRPSDTRTLGRPVAGSKCTILNNDHQQTPKGVAGTLFCTNFVVDVVLPEAQIISNMSINSDLLMPDWAGVTSSEQEQQGCEFQIHHSACCVCCSEGHLFPTADIVVVNTCGQLEFVKKSPSQLEYIGSAGRVSFQTLEVVVRQMSGVEDCMSLQHQTDLVVLFKASGDVGIVVEDLKDFLSERLPDDLIPSYVFSVRTLPADRIKAGEYIARCIEGESIRTGDKSRVFVPSDDDVSTASSSPGNSPTARSSGPSQRIFVQKIRPSSPPILGTVKNLCQAELQMTAAIDPDQSLFHQGASSLNIVMIISLIASKLNCQISTRDVLANPTIRHLSNLVKIAQLKENRPITVSPYASESSATSVAQIELFERHMESDTKGDYNVYVHAVVKKGTIDFKRLADCLQKVVNNHDMLRSTFRRSPTTGMVKQQITRPNSTYLDITELDYNHLTSSSTDATNLLKEEARLPFDLTTDCLIRVRLFVFKDSPVFQLVSHQIIMDDHSLGVVMRDLQSCYSDQTRATLLSSPKTVSGQWALPYPSYTQFEKRLMLKEGTTDICQRMSDLSKVDKPAVVINSLSSSISSTNIKKIDAISKSLGATRTSLILTLYAVVLSATVAPGISQLAVLFGNRVRSEFLSTVGAFSNVLPVTVPSMNTSAFKTVVEDIFESVGTNLNQQWCRKAVDNCKYLFVDAIQSPQQLSKHTMTHGNSKLTMDDVVLSSLSIPQNYCCRSARGFDLSMSIHEGPDAIVVQFVFNETVFSEASAETVRSSFTQLVTFLCDDVLFTPGMMVSSLFRHPGSLLPADARDSLALRSLPQSGAVDAGYSILSNLQQLLSLPSDRSGGVKTFLKGCVKTFALSEIMAFSGVIVSKMSEMNIQDGSSVAIFTSGVSVVASMVACVQAKVAFTVVRCDVNDVEEVIGLCKRHNISGLITANGDVDDDQSVKIIPVATNGERENCYSNTLFFTVDASSGSLLQKFTDSDLHLYITETCPSMYNWSSCTSVVLPACCESPFEVFGCILNGGVIYYSDADDLLSVTDAGFNPTDVFLPASRLIRALKNSVVPDSIGTVYFGSRCGGEVSEIASYLSTYPDTRFVRITFLTYECHGVPALSLDLHRHISQEHHSMSTLGLPLPTVGTAIIGKNSEITPFETIGELHLSGSGIVASSDVEGSDFTFVQNPKGDHHLYLRTGIPCSWNASGVITSLESSTLNNRTSYKGRLINLEVVAQLIETHQKVTAAVVTRHQRVQGDGIVEVLEASVLLTDTLTGSDIQFFLRSKFTGSAIPDIFTLQTGISGTETNNLCIVPSQTGESQHGVVVSRVDVSILHHGMSISDLIHNLHGGEGIDLAASIVSPELAISRQPGSRVEIQTLLLGRCWFADCNNLSMNIVGSGADLLLIRRISSLMSSFFAVNFTARSVLECATIRSLAARIQSTDPLQFPPPDIFPDKNQLSHIQLQLLSGPTHIDIQIVYICVDMGGKLIVTSVQSAVEMFAVHQDLLQVEFTNGSACCEKSTAKLEIAVQTLETDSIQDGVRQVVSECDFFKGESAHGKELITACILNECHLVLACHPLLSDVDGLKVMSDFIAESVSDGGRASAVVSPRSYLRFASTQRMTLQSEIGDRGFGYWNGLLHNSTGHLSFPWDRNDDVCSFSTEKLIVEKKVVDLLFEVSVKFKTVPVIVLGSLIATVIHQSTGQTDLMMGIVDTLRTHIKDFSTLGNYTKAVPARVAFSRQGNDVFAGVLRSLATQVSESLSYNFVPEAAIANSSLRHRSLMANPLFNILVSHNNITNTRITEQSDPISGLEDFVFTLTQGNTDNKLSLRYNDGKMNQRSAEKLLKRVGLLLGKLSSILPQPCGSIRSEEGTHLDKVLPSSAIFSSNSNDSLRSKLLSCAAKYETNTLYKEFDGELQQATSVTFEDFFNKAKALAGVLQHSGKKLVSIDEAVPRSGPIRLLCIIATILSGKTYLVESGELCGYRNWGSSQNDVFVVSSSVLDNLPQGNAVDYDPDQPLADTIFTIDGAQGRYHHTQGIVVEHSNWFVDAFSVTESDTFMCLDHKVSDVIVGSISSLPLFCAGVVPFILSGASIGFSDPRKISSCLQISFEEATALSVKKMDVSIVSCSGTSTMTLDSVRHVLVPCAPRAPSTQSSQITFVFCLTDCFGIVAMNQREPPQNNSLSYSIGTPTTPYTLLVIDKQKRTTDEGVAGELVLQSKHLKWEVQEGQKSQQTKQRKITSLPSGSAYRTDIIASELDGCFHYFGMKDTFWGYKKGMLIDCGYIQRVLVNLNSNAVSNAALLVREESTGDKRLIAYVQRTNTAPATKEIIQQVYNSQFGVLPPRFLVDRVIVLDHLPVVDIRKTLKLAASQNQRSRLTQKYVPPSTPLQFKVFLAFSEAMGNTELVPVSCCESLFHIGGDVRTANRITTTLNTLLPLKSPLKPSHLLQYPTPLMLSDFINTTIGLTGDLPAEYVVTEDDVDTAKSDIDISTCLHIVSDQAADIDGQYESHDILLTGATGFIGSFVLNELLLEKRSSNQTILCLVRARSKTTAEVRIRETFTRYELDTTTLQNAITSGLVKMIPGDVELPYLGLCASDWTSITQTVSAIIHLAGNTMNLRDFPYKLLRNANVVGTRTIISLASTFRTKRIVFASRSTSTINEKLIEEITSPGVLSDVVCMRLLKEVAQSGHPVTTFGLDTVSGSTLTGVSPVGKIRERLLLCCMLMKAAPDIQNQHPLLPVDYCSKVIAGLARESISIGKHYVVSVGTLTLNSIISHMHSRHHLLMHRIPLTEWKSKLMAQFASTNTSAPLQRVASHLFTFSDENFICAEMPSVNTSQVQSDLMKIGKPVPMPRIDKVLISTYVGYYQSLRLLGKNV